VLSALSNALVALGRISDFLTAEELPEPYKISQGSPTAVHVQGSFTWESVAPSDTEELTKKSSDQTRKQDDSKKTAKRDSKAAPVLPSSTVDFLDEKVKQIPHEELGNVNGNDDEKPFELTNLSITVPHGAFIGIVGRVGCGKVNGWRHPA
jgi:ATP-binding cassette subfamily C (CFTR/MRP) protein 1